MLDATMIFVGQIVLFESNFHLSLMQICFLGNSSTKPGSISFDGSDSLASSASLYKTWVR